MELRPGCFQIFLADLSQAYLTQPLEVGDELGDDVVLAVGKLRIHALRHGYGGLGTYAVVASLIVDEHHLQTVAIDEGCGHAHEDIAIGTVEVGFR